MTISNELLVLIEAIKVSLLEASPETFTRLLKQEQLDWERMEKMSQFHAIQPVLYDAFQKISFENDFVKKLKETTTLRVMINLAISQELGRLLQLLQNQQIRVLPYKGLLFTSELYLNKQLRETSDVDLLVHPADAKRALAILLADGYKFEDRITESLTNEEVIEKTVGKFGTIEIGLDKINTFEINTHIDFHWNLFEEYWQYKIDFTDFYENQQVKNLNGKEVFIPAEKDIFLMLLNHHGGRESWLRLKHFCDFICFFKVYGHKFDFNYLVNLSEQAGMKRIFETGFYIYQNNFLAPEKQQFSAKKNAEMSNLSEKIISYWEENELWLKPPLKIKYETISLKLKDDDYSLTKYLAGQYRFFSTPNFTENKRLITFPDSYKFLNFVSKFITFIWKYTIKGNFVKV